MKKLFFLVFFIPVLLTSTNSIAKGGHGGHGGGHGHSGGHSGHGGHGGGFGHGGGHSAHVGSHIAARGTNHSTAMRGRHYETTHRYGPRSRRSIIREPHAPISIHNYHHHRYVPYLSYWVNFGPYYHPYWFREVYPTYTDSEQTNTIYGYVVYNNDTIAGQAYMNEDVIGITKNDGSDSAYTFEYTDSNLNCITLYSNGQEMYLVRLKEKEDEFWRVVHAGKLCLYDDNFSFSFEPEDVNFDDMQVLYNGKLEPLSDGKIFSSDKKRLVEFINKAYDLNMNPRYFNKEEVLKYLQTLN